jgi:cyclophilin family peptidyl-prolyl cis-trans isomerase
LETRWDVATLAARSAPFVSYFIGRKAVIRRVAFAVVTAALLCAAMMGFAPPSSFATTVPDTSALGGSVPESAPKTDTRPRLLFTTTKGQIMVVLYNDVAPKTVAQLTKFAEAGIYDGIPFARIEPGFVVQVADERGRATPLTTAQSAVLTRIPLEVKRAITPNQKLATGQPLHRRGVLSLAHADGDVDSGGVSFSFLLGDAPHLDGEYTVFGEIERGQGVIDTIAALKTEKARPLESVLIQDVAVLDAVAAAKVEILDLPAPVSGPRVVFSTTAGDFVVQLEPTLTPLRVERLRELLAARAYDGVTVLRTRALSYVQLGSTAAVAMKTGVKPDDWRAESTARSKNEQHFVGALTMSDDEWDANGKIGSLSITLANNGSLDPLYTRVGSVIGGLENIREMSSAATDKDGFPKESIRVLRAELLTDDAPLPALRATQSLTATQSTAKSTLVIGVVLCVVGLVLARFAKRIPIHVISALGALVTLMAFFLVWTEATRRPSAGTMGIVCFALGIGIFRLMSGFERKSTGSMPPAFSGPAIARWPNSAQHLKLINSVHSIHSIRKHCLSLNRK